MNQGAGNRALGYVRVSTDEQAEDGYSLPQQRAKVEAFCRRQGLELLEVVTDDFTGRMLKRPGLSRVTQMAEAGAFDVLVCVKLDRLARKNHLRAGYEEKLRHLNIRVEFVEQRFEQTVSGRLQRNIMGDFDEYESEKIAENTAGGRMEKARTRGAMPIGYAPLGFHQITKAESLVLKDFLGRSGELVVNEEEAVVVRRIFSLVAGGASLRTVAATLTAEGLRTRLGAIWTRSTVHRILENEAYIGRRYYGMRECRPTGELTANGYPREVRRLRDRSEWIAMECPAIVSEALFLACQAQLVRNKEQLRGRPAKVFTLNGVATCGACQSRDGLALRCTSHRWGGAGKGRRYICNSFTDERRGYCGASYHGPRLEEMALVALRYATEPMNLATLARGRAEERLASAGDPRGEVLRLERELADLDQQEERLLDGTLAGTFSAPIVQRRAEAIRRRRVEIARELVTARQGLASLIAPDAAARLGESAAERLRAALPDAQRDPKALRDLFRAYLDVQVFPDRAPRITVRVPDYEGK